MVEDGTMELRVDNSQFSPNHGGGGGTFYQGRQGQQRRDEDEAAAESSEAPAKGLAGDSCFLPENRRSSLGLFLPPAHVVTAEEAVDLDGVDDEIHRNLRVMTLMMIRLERDFEARMRVEVGDVVVGF
jgi:hypothetical protein